jgi:RNA polymerase sigma factor (sigma-70 family)
MSLSYLPARPAAVAKPQSVTIRQDQIAAFYVELRSALCASLRRWKLPDEEVEDLVQETFVRLLSNGPEDLKAEAARYWLFRVAHNLAIDHRRSGWRSLLDSQANFEMMLSVCTAANCDPETIYLHGERWRVAQGILARLTPRQQTAIRLRIAGLSYKAIAHQLKSTTKSVAELIRRGLKRLRENRVRPDS